MKPSAHFCNLAIAVALLVDAGLTWADDTNSGDGPASSTSSGFYSGNAEGWFWYKDPPTPKPAPLKKPENKSTPAAPPKDDAMNVAWLRKKLPELLDKAIDNPTHENVAAYLAAQRVVLDKAQRFEEEAQMVSLTEPLLDQTSRVPVTGYTKNAFLDTNFKAKEEAIKYLSKNTGGLFVFVESTCLYCKAQAIQTNELARNYGFDLRYITVDGKGFNEIGNEQLVADKGIAQKLGIKIFPTTVFVVPPSSFLIVAQGVMSQSDLKDRILMAAEHEHLLPKNLEPQVNPWDRGVLDTADTQHGATDDPAQLLKNVKEKLEPHYDGSQ
ncbi:conjugal transfer protein TraF [Ferrovum myxofaciens]|uniref:Conjugal transfer protein TraF n=1 Tax=Ferrovum myxofaciens TaxID=416213 RepID=A0A9E6MYG0_9PROT|nr:conjugal transfer protein TraF [Ferrovum myxofaciens]QKE37369.1 MAG: conjugal transfer protein TraF [Ferrovum myxofaciens]QWY75023.1 MAG: conjugal transfer protein TraF [Ferrovum myxofaciens]QWY77763.1 MAG: conjugal transfer protein TraF [Ferrovum myxofaciens]